MSTKQKAAKAKTGAAPKPKKVGAANQQQPTAPALPVRGLVVFAGPCPVAGTHQNTSVYRTVGQTRYCKCNDCGHTWKKIGPVAGELAQVGAAAAAEESTDDKGGDEVEGS